MDHNTPNSRWSTPLPLPFSSWWSSSSPSSPHNDDDDDKDDISDTSLLTSPNQLPTDPRSSAWSTWLWSWWPSFEWPQWNTTSAEHLRRAELEMLRASGLEDIERHHTMVPVSPDGLALSTYRFDGNGPPLVLLHGFGAGNGFWAANISSLRESHTVFLVDLPGFGRSTRPPVTFATADEADAFFREALRGWFDQMKLPPCHLLGHSFGAYVAAQYAIAHPDHVAHLILADPWGVASKSTVPLRRASGPLLRVIRPIAMAYFKVFYPLSIVRSMGPLAPAVVRRARTDICAKFRHLLEDADTAVSSYIYHLNAQYPTGEAAFSRLQVPIGWAERPIQEHAHKLRADMPVTFLYGDHTWMSVGAGRQTMHALNEHHRQQPPRSGAHTDRVTMHIINNAGHHIYIDGAEQFNRVVKQETARAANFARS